MASWTNSVGNLKGELAEKEEETPSCEKRLAYGSIINVHKLM